MLPTEKDVNYRGRKTHQSGSEQRRKAILEAALRIIIREGVRGVRHRAVAKEAGVPLSATTYYFKDISDLITDTFTLFAEKRMTQEGDLYKEDVAEYLSQHDLEKIRADGLQDQVVADVALLVAKHLYTELEDRRGDVMAEQTFLHEAVRDKRLQPLALEYRHTLECELGPILELCGSRDIKLDAKLLLISLLHLQYEGLIDAEKPNLEALNRSVMHLFLSFSSQPS
ncbi:MAG: TetR family transcriptional regulator [Pseudomonadales bacterium]|nr:TetR family transcriptional regulator [Pseudomonadales bacterium]